MSWLPPSDGWLSITDTVALSYEIGWLRHRRIFSVLMYLGVSGFQTFDSALGRYGAVFLAVTVFILSGFEHCIANMYYYSMAGVWDNGRAWLTMLVMVLGNAAGSVIIAEGYRLSQKLLE